MTESPTGVASDGVACAEHDGEVHEGDTEAAAPLNRAEGGVYVEGQFNFLSEYFEDMYEQFP